MYTARRIATLVLLLCALTLVATAQSQAQQAAKGAPAAIAAPATKAADAPRLKPQTTCPLMDNPINKSLFVDAKGYRIYVCCPGCIETVKKDPDKAIAALKAKGEQPEALPVSPADGKTTATAAKAADNLKPQTTCPITGKPIDRKYFADVNGSRIYLCCPRCVPAVEKQPDKAIATLKSRGEKPESIPSK